MSIEIGVVCPQRPDAQVLARVAGFALRASLDVPDVELSLVEEDDVWRFRWGGAGQVVAFLTPPGRHEYAGHWYLTFEMAAGDEHVAELLMIVTSAVTALLTGGRLDTDNYVFEREDPAPEALLAQILRAAPLEPEAAVHLLRTGRPQSTAS
ncbi:hypothetical protein ACGFJC_15835 [Nonomuraea fuscirosea]|uniref:hypothetical protein n=1 Tax=Nonomuraea fuscirosea TaxID=1291556 RepID=UPI00342E2CE1